MVGYEGHNSAFEQSVVRLASRLCGGCTVSAPDGFWMGDGAERKSTFNGTLYKERCFQIDLTTEPEKFAHVMRMMQVGIAGFAQSNEVDTDWVHVKSVEIVAHHFSILATNKDLSRRQI